MKPFRPLTAAEQAAQHLRDEILQRRVSGEMPGIHHLAAELALNHKTVKTALELLQKEGLLSRKARAGRAGSICGAPDRRPVCGLRSCSTSRMTGHSESLTN